MGPRVSVAGTMIACLLFTLSLPVVATIQGSAHDFSRLGWSNDESCAVCHTPHNADFFTDAPLWDHDISTTTYTLYSSASLGVILEQPGPGNISRLCLSCHDGTIAIDSFGGNGGQTYISERASLGTDLSNDHPIGIKWNHRGDRGSYPIGNEVELYDGKVECPSCHDVHNNQVADVKLLRSSLAGSRLCFQCHDK